MRKTVQIQQELKKEFPDLPLNQEQAEKIQAYLELLQKWNKKFNLTAIREPKEIFGKHILDSLAPFKLSIPLQGKIVDMGSGAGLPGIVLSIVKPELEMISIEKIQKKITFQDIAKAQLKLSHFQPLSSRLENLHQDSQYQGQFDFVISRALSQLNDLFQLGLPFLKKGGFFLLWKGKKWSEELEAVQPQFLEQVSLVENQEYQFSNYEVGGRLLLFRRES